MVRTQYRRRRFVVYRTGKLRQLFLQLCLRPKTAAALLVFLLSVILITAGTSGCRTAAGTGLVEAAVSQVGEDSGKKYWKWYGYEEAVDWCGCFVSWCIAQDRSIGEENRPRFSYCPDGMDWFESRNLWYAKNTAPKPGMIIFFDWNQNEEADHVGIVKSFQNGEVLVIEGDSGGRCEENVYDRDDDAIMGYGLLQTA